MAQQDIDVGTFAGDGTGDPLRDAFTKINDNFTELYSTVNNEGLTYGNIASNVAGITFNVTRYTENYAATPVLEGTGQVVGNVYLIRGNVLGGTTPLNDVYLTVSSLANVTVGNIATVTATGVPVAPVLRVNGLTGNVTLSVNNITGAASKAYVDNSIAANLANVTTTITNSLNANITAANAVISNHTSRIGTLESNSAAQATQINNLVSVKANISYVDTSIGLALSSNAILANVASVNANVAAANAQILTRASLNGANFSGNVESNFLKSRTSVRAQTYFVAGSETDQGLGQTWANPAALFFGNSTGTAEKFYQVNLQNVDPAGSGDFVVTADDGNDGDNFIAFGIAGSLSNEPEYPSQKSHDGYVFIRGGDLDIQSETGNVEIIAGNLAVGQVILTSGNIVKFGPNVQLQFADGTLQSTAFGGNANVSAINSNLAAVNAAISILQANASAQSLDLDNLRANAGTQGGLINVLNANTASQAAAVNSITANIGAYQTFANANAATQATAINAINANVLAANVRINTLLSNAASQSLDIDNLYGNATAQQASIVALQANAAVQAVLINNFNVNFSAITSNINSLNSNAAVQGLEITLLNANLAAANIRVSSLQSNAETQSIQIGSLETNVGITFSQLVAVNANVVAANTKITILDANLGSATQNISTLQSNVITLNTNKANLSGAVFSGNVTANNLLANNSAKIGSTLEVGDPSPVAYPGLAGTFIGNVSGYYQLVVQNTDSGSSSSGDIVITADDGDDTNYYLNIGVNSSNWSGNFEVPSGDTGIPEFAHDAYFTAIGGNIALRTDSNIFFIANTVGAGLFKDSNFTLIGADLEFSDGSIQSTAVTDVPGLLANIINLQNDFSISDANIGAFQTYANLTFAPDSYTNSNVKNYLSSFDGNIIPSANVTYDLGSSSLRWRDLWLSGNTIYIGEANITANGSAVALPPGSTIAGNPIGSSSFANANIKSYLESLSNVNIGIDTGVGQSFGAVSIGNAAGKLQQGWRAVALGLDAGAQNQGSYSVALGTSAGNVNQGYSSAAIGDFAGENNQGYESVAIGTSSGVSNQGNTSVALGAYAGLNDQKDRAISVGYYAGRTSQGLRSIAIGESAGNTSQGLDTVAIGSSGFYGNTYGGQSYSAGGFNQGNYAVAIGTQAGAFNQGSESVAIGDLAGARNQGSFSVAIGLGAGQINQSTNSVAVGDSSAIFNQGPYSVAIGKLAGRTRQGFNSIAIGYQSGYSDQANNSIILSATGELNSNTQGFFVDPIRSLSTGNVLYYNPLTKEISYGNLSYTPANAANYNSTITNIQQALDELAERIKALGG